MLCGLSFLDISLKTFSGPIYSLVYLYYKSLQLAFIQGQMVPRYLTWVIDGAVDPLKDGVHLHRVGHCQVLEVGCRVDCKKIFHKPVSLLIETLKSLNVSLSSSIVMYIGSQHINDLDC